MEITPHSPQSEDKSAFEMVDVGGKTITRRRALAEGTLILSGESFRALKDGTIDAI